jgi:probable addiction module antidote protein
VEATLDLNTPKDVSDYLAEAFATSDPLIITQAIGTVARHRGMMLVAREAGLSRENLYRALSGGKNPRLGTIIRVLNAFGLQLTVRSGAGQKKQVGSKSRVRAR